MTVACPVCGEGFRNQQGVTRHIGGVHEVPWQDEQTLRKLHQQYGMSGRQIAKKLGCSTATACRWLNKYEVLTPVSFSTKPDKGYEQWRNGKHMVYVHRLLGVSEYGFDAVSNHVIHHKNGVPWDNRPENIEPLPKPDHHGEHKKTDGVERKAIAYAYEFTDMSSYDIANTCDYQPPSVVRIWREYFS